MFVPLHDGNSLKYIRVQYVTWTLIAINVAVFLLTALSGGESEFSKGAVIGLGFIPAVVNDIQELPVSLALVPENLTYITYSFLHADWLHLGSNMLFLWVFGDNVEDALGHFKFLIFYFACAAAGAFMHGLLLADSVSPLIGASGAVAGVVAAYLMLHPRVRVWVLVLGRIPLPLPAFIPLLFWVGMQFYMVFADPDGQVSWATHVGGILAGALLTIVLKRRGVPLFDRSIESPKAVVHTEGPPPLPNKKASEKTTQTKPPHWGR